MNLNEIKMFFFASLFAGQLAILSAPANASSYKDSEFSAQNPATDVTDFFISRSWEDPSKIVLILNTDGGQPAGNGPAASGFDPEAIYRINIDNNANGRADDVIYEFKFKNGIREINSLPNAPFFAIGHPNLSSLGLRGVLSLDGDGSEGLRFCQNYKVTEIRDGKRHLLC